MSTENDILFLKGFREKIARYLFLGCSPPEIFTYSENKGVERLKLDLERQRKIKESMKNQDVQAQKQEIEADKNRAQNILARCGVSCILTQYPLATLGGPVLRFNLLDLITANKTRSTLNLKTFTDKIDEALVILAEKKRPPVPKSADKEAEPAAGRLYLALATGVQDSAQQIIYDVATEVGHKLGFITQRAEATGELDQLTDNTLNCIQSADVVIIDLTTSRPQVFYQAGYAQALGKKVVYLLKKNIPLKINLNISQPIIYTIPQELTSKLTDRLTALVAMLRK